MSFSTFSGPIRSGTVRYGATENVGLVTLAQSYDTGNLLSATGNYDVLFGYVPAGSQIIDIVVDQVVAAATGTMTISVGSTSGGAELMAAVVTTAGGRFRGTATAGTQLAWQTSTTADTPIYVRDVVGTATLTAGSVIINVAYVVRNPDGSIAPTAFTA